MQKDTVYAFTPVEIIGYLKNRFPRRNNNDISDTLLNLWLNYAALAKLENLLPDAICPWCFILKGKTFKVRPDTMRLSAPRDVELGPIIETAVNSVCDMPINKIRHNARIITNAAWINKKLHTMDDVINYSVNAFTRHYETDWLSRRQDFVNAMHDNVHEQEEYYEKVNKAFETYEKSKNHEE